MERIIRKAEAHLHEGDTAGFLSALTELCASPPSADLVMALLGLLVEEEDRHHEMFAILHAVEHQRPEHVHEGLASAFAETRSRAPEWADTILARLLLADPARAGLDSRGFSRALRLWGSPESRSAVAASLRSLRGQQAESSDLALRAEQLLAEVEGGLVSGSNRRAP